MAKTTTAQIIFDLDGTLINTSERHYLVYKILISELGGTPLSKSEYWHLKRQKITTSQLLTLSQVNQRLSDNYNHRFLKLIEEPEYLKLDSLFPVVKSLLQYLSQKYHLSLVTLRRRPENTQNQLRLLNLDHYFNNIKITRTGQNSLTAKIQATKSIRKLKPCIFIGDTEIDIQTAQALNCKSVALTSGIRNPIFLKPLHPDLILKSLSELTPRLISSLIQRSSETPG